MVSLMEKKNYDLTQITQLLLEMRDNCVPKDGNLYDDPKRTEKYEALKAAIDLINNPSQLVTGDINTVPTLSLNTLRDAIYQDAVKHGLWEPGVLLLKQAKGDEKMASLALGVSLILGEAQEFVEAIDDPKKMEEELADIAIMCFSFAGRMGIDIDAAIRRKMEINKGRPWKHGKSDE